MCFFFQAEDGIRDKLVTGVQTCALPIYDHPGAAAAGHVGARARIHRGRRVDRGDAVVPAVAQTRAARVGTPQTRASRGAGGGGTVARTATCSFETCNHNLSWG